MKKIKLLTKELRRKIPPLYGQEDAGNDAVVYAKFFTPDSNFTWYVIEGSAAVPAGPGRSREIPLKDSDPETEIDVRFFGWIVGQYSEYGYFLLSELKEARGPYGLPIERDRHFRPGPMRDVIPSHERSYW